MEAFKKSLAKFGIVELVRTGRISLKRGERVFDTGAWVRRWAGVQQAVQGRGWAAAGSQGLL